MQCCIILKLLHRATLLAWFPTCIYAIITPVRVRETRHNIAELPDGNNGIICEFNYGGARARARGHENEPDVARIVPACFNHRALILPSCLGFWRPFHPFRATARKMEFSRCAGEHRCVQFQIFAGYIHAKSSLSYFRHSVSFFCCRLISKRGNWLKFIADGGVKS